MLPLFEKNRSLVSKYQNVKKPRCFCTLTLCNFDTRSDVRIPHHFPFSILNFQLSKRLSQANLAPRAVHFQSSILNFQLSKHLSQANLAPRAVHFQSSILNFQLSKRLSQANPAPRAVHFQSSILNFQLSKRLSQANPAPKAVPLCTRQSCRMRPPIVIKKQSLVTVFLFQGV
jgi:hypothetical protein